MAEFIMRELDRLVMEDPKTNKLLLSVDEVKTWTFTNGQNTSYAEGKNNARVMAFDDQVTTGFKLTSAYVNTGYWSLATGALPEKVTNGREVRIPEYHTVTDVTKITLNRKPAGVTGNEIGFIYALGKDGDIADSYSQAAEASATEFSLNEKVLTLPTNKFKIGDTVVVPVYPTFTEYEKMKKTNQTFSRTVRVIVDMFGYDLCDGSRDEKIQLVLPLAKVSGSMDLSGGNEAVIQNMEVEGIMQNCPGKEKVLWQIIRYNESNIVV